MKRLLWIIVAMAGLVAVVTGCDGMHRYDSRLVAADGLMHDDADSALALVEAIDAGSLTTDGDRAYRDLLLTQARYRCYIAATSDSAINRALAYYRAHDGEREKLTRCHLYKGAVMEELGHVDSAMTYYKTAEATAAPDDYFNLGQINTRIANLYRLYYGDEETCFEKYKQALHFHRLTGNKPQQQNCLLNMASSAMNTGRPYQAYLDQSMALAVELNDSVRMYHCQELRCCLLSMDDNNHMRESKQVGLDCWHNYSRYVDYLLVLDLAFIYASENQIDSAKYFLNVLDTSRIDSQSYMSLRRNWIQSVIAAHEGDTVMSNYYSTLKSAIADSIDNNKQKNIIQQVENEANAMQINADREKSQKRNIILTLLLSIISFISILLLIRYYLNIHKTKSIIRELKNAQVDYHEKLLQQLDIKDSVIETFIQNMVTFMQTSINASETESPNVVRQRIKDTVNSVANDDFWNQLRHYLDRNHNNIITNIAQNPKITQEDLRLIELECCGFSYIEEAVTLGYSPNFISNKRARIARKLGLKTSLSKYVNQLMGEKAPSNNAKP